MINPLQAQLFLTGALFGIIAILAAIAVVGFSVGATRDATQHQKFFVRGVAVLLFLTVTGGFGAFACFALLRMNIHG